MPFELNLEDGEFLIKLARHVVEEYLTRGRKIATPNDTPKILFEHSGVFVTINSLKSGKKRLRGCIGYPCPNSPLIDAVIDSAISAATQDPRFYPISKAELEQVVFEVSVLTPPERITVEKPEDYPLKIRVGEDGLIVENGFSKGLLLPQVPIEWEWNEEEFLCQCCMKAGLPPDSWLTKGTKIYKFRAIVFEEETPKGEVKLRNLAK